ncbi:PepSY domain-containing protein [Streptomyces sp. NPDC057363]|uniref:PepSY domain-containing protein n=1 Tax=Streptomyces sp. NPDC057363 TaxID=3346107 RepID=UPI003638C45A
MTHWFGGSPAWARTASVLPAALVCGTLLATASACAGPPPERRPEVLPEVEVPYDRAVRTALAEVPGSEVVSVRLRRAPDQGPQWLVRVAAEDGSVRLLRVAATDGRVLTRSVPAEQSTDGQARTAALVAAARVLPEEAVGKVKRPEFGKVSAIALEDGPDDSPVWSVTLDVIAPVRTRWYKIDAVTSDVLDARTGAPGGHR